MEVEWAACTSGVTVPPDFTTFLNLRYALFASSLRSETKSLLMMVVRVFGS